METSAGEIKEAIYDFCPIPALIIGLCAGRLISGRLFRNSSPEPKEFTSSGMTVTLTKDFTEDNVMGFTYSCRSKDVYMLALREAFSEAEGLKDLTLDEYRDILLEVNELTDARVDTFDGIPGFEYDYEDEDGNAVEIQYQYDEPTGTALFTYLSRDKAVTVRGKK